MGQEVNASAVSQVTWVKHKKRNGKRKCKARATKLNSKMVKITKQNIVTPYLVALLSWERRQVRNES